MLQWNLQAVKLLLNCWLLLSCCRWLLPNCCWIASELLPLGFRGCYSPGAWHPLRDLHWFGWQLGICHVYNVYLWYQIYLCHHWFHVIWVTPIIEYHWSWWKMISICIICIHLSHIEYVTTCEYHVPCWHSMRRAESRCFFHVFQLFFRCRWYADAADAADVVELSLRIVGSLGGLQVKSSQTSPAGKLCGKSMHQQLKPQMTAEKLWTDAHLQSQPNGQMEPHLQQNRKFVSVETTQISWHFKVLERQSSRQSSPMCVLNCSSTQRFIAPSFPLLGTSHCRCHPVRSWRQKTSSCRCSSCSFPRI